MNQPAPSTQAPERSPAVAVVRRVLIVTCALGVAVLIASKWGYWVGEARHQTTDDAFLQTDLTPIGAKVSGYVRSAPTQDYAHVEAGQLLVELVDDDYRAALSQAEANVTVARAVLKNLAAQRALQGATIDAAAAVVRQSTAVLARNHRETVRQKTLLTAGAGSDQAMEIADTAERQSAGQLDQNRAQWEATRRQLQVLAAEEEQAQGQLEASLAARNIARLNLSYTQIRAPTAGVTAQRQVRPGQYVTIGQQVAVVTPLPDVWVIANFKETQLRRMWVGQKAYIRIDAFPDHLLDGKVVAFAPGSGSQFSLLPPDNATGNFTKVVQRLAVKIALSSTGELAGRLRPGLSVIATVDVADRTIP